MVAYISLEVCVFDTVARMGDMRNAYRISDGKTEGKMEFVRPKLRWEVNTKVGLKNRF